MPVKYARNATAVTPSGQTDNDDDAAFDKSPNADGQKNPDVQQQRPRSSLSLPSGMGQQMATLLSQYSEDYAVPLNSPMALICDDDGRPQS